MQLEGTAHASAYAQQCGPELCVRNTRDTLEQYNLALEQQRNTKTELYLLKMITNMVVRE
jgi:hypothetical protein